MIHVFVSSIVALSSLVQRSQYPFTNVNHNRKLQEIYQEINKLEKTEIEEFKYYNYEEHFRPLVLLALGLFLFEILLRFTIFRSFI